MTTTLTGAIVSTRPIVGFMSPAPCQRNGPAGQ
jgi:hypothetical protein